MTGEKSYLINIRSKKYRNKTYKSFITSRNLGLLEVPYKGYYKFFHEKYGMSLSRNQVISGMNIFGKKLKDKIIKYHENKKYYGSWRRFVNIERNKEL